jgi:glycerate 2-kinase
MPIRQALLLGLTYNLYRLRHRAALRMSTEPSALTKKQGVASRRLTSRQTNSGLASRPQHCRIPPPFACLSSYTSPITAMERKHLARNIFLRTLQAVDPCLAIERCLSLSGRLLCCSGRAYDLRQFVDIRVLAVGKAAHRMLAGLDAILPHETKLRGVVSAPTPPETSASPRYQGPRANLFSDVQYFAGGHPEPNEHSLLAGRAALELARNSTSQTLLIVLLSGGGSALMESPLLTSLSLSEIQQLNRALVTCGAPIHEINTVRKHISAIKGGRLAQAAHPASVITLAISDVPVGRESALASGPTLPDPTTCADALNVLAKYDMRDRLPKALSSWVDSGAMPETPKASDLDFVKNQFELVLGMHELFHAAHRFVEAKRCIACCENSTDDWPVEKAAAVLIAQLEQLQASNPGQPVALIADGELSSAVTGDGLGGRNSAFVLACVEKIAGKPIVVLSAGTDGIDGNSPAAGAVADGQTLTRARHAGLDPRDFFQRSDSFRFFEALGDAILTGPTGNNLRDLRLLLSLPE